MRNFLIFALKMWGCIAAGVAVIAGWLWLLLNVAPVAIVILAIFFTFVAWMVSQPCQCDRCRRGGYCGS